MENKKVKAFINTVSLSIFFVTSLSAQYSDTLSQKEIHDIHPTTSYPKIDLEFRNLLSTDYTRHSLWDAKFPLKKEGIFCQWEDQIIQKSRIPVKFRLGSLQYADQLEGKVDYSSSRLLHRP